MKILNSLKSLGDGEGRRHCRSLETATFQILDLAQAEQHGRGGHSWDLAVLASHSHVRCFPYIHPQDSQNIKIGIAPFCR